MHHRTILKTVCLGLLAVILSGNIAQSLGKETAQSEQTGEERLSAAVALYPGSMYSLVKGSLVRIDMSNELITPFVQNGRTLVPVRFIAESFGAAVTWESSTQTAVISTEIRTIRIRLYSMEMTVNGQSETLDVPAMATGGRIFVPVRALAEALGKEVFYDSGLIVIGNDGKVFDPETDRELIRKTIRTVNVLPSVGSRENLVRMLSEAGAGQYGFSRDDLAWKETAASPAADGDSAEGSSGAANEYSGTNIQVSGVDEGDIVKTDGTYLYQIGTGEILIFRVYPADEMTLVSRIPFEGGTFEPQEMYISGNDLVVIGSAYSYSVYADEGTESVLKAEPVYYSETATKILIFDLTDRQKPVKGREVSLPGNTLSSRLIGRDLYVVCNQYIYNWSDAAAPLKPKYSDTAAGPGIMQVEYGDIRYMPPVVSSSYLVVAALSLDEPGKPVNLDTYLGAGSEIYVSENSLYVAVNEGYGGIRFMTIAEDGYFPPDTQEATLIYKFALNNASAAYSARGQVPGRTLNQFSMDENGGYFRIATTSGYSWMSGEGGSVNALYILDGDLSIAGRLEGMARGETIYSVRFMGDRAYVVTFRTVDPLFVIDLNNPKAPRVLGSLKIPGYSNYLHPYDENHIIGFGKDAITVSFKDAYGNEAGVGSYYMGMKVALFDVSDVANPIEKFTVSIGDRGTESEILYDHKALFFDKERELIAFPVNEAKVTGPVIDPISGYPHYGETVFSGAYVYHLNPESGFTLRGKLSHFYDSEKLQSGYYGMDYNRQIRRILRIGDVLYASSNGRVSAYDSGSLQELGRVSAN